MSEEDEIDLDYYSKVVKKQSRNESDQLRDLKRKLEDNKVLEEELDKEEREMIQDALKSQADMLEQMASNAKQVLEEKINGAD